MMESTQQYELILMSEMDPPSPSKCSNTEELLFGDDFAIDLFSKSDDGFTGIDFLAELDKDGKMYLDELQQITDKIDLPLYDFVTGNDIHQTNFINQKQLKSEQLLMEFDAIYDPNDFDLTPPQTPPEQKMFYGGVEESQQFDPNIPTTIEQQQEFYFDYQPTNAAQNQQFIYDVQSPEQEVSVIFENSNQSSDDYFIVDPEQIISSPADIQRELEVVDELIQAHSRSQSDYDDDNCTSFTSSSWSQDDEPVKKSSSLRGVTKKRTRPYGRNPDEKKSRKKEQNKNAATRYRQKKKEEVHVILGEERGLMDKNKKLSTAFNDTRREVKYLKSLLRELFQARGFIQ